MNNQENTTFGFIFSLLTVFFLLVTSCITIQLVVDPKNQYNLVKIPSLEALKVPLVNSSKDKTNLIQNTNANCIILGTSRAELAINPEHIPDFNCINLSMIHGTVEDMRDILLYALQYMDIELIVWGIDYEMFTNNYGKVRHKYRIKRNNLKQKKSNRQKKQWASQRKENPKQSLSDIFTFAQLKSLASFENFKQAIELIAGKSVPGSKAHLNNGQRKKEQWQNSFERNGHLAMFKRNEKKFIHRNVYLNNEDRKYHKRLQQSQQAFEEILIASNQHNISVYAFISPVHIRQLILIDASRRFDDFQRWKIDLLTTIESSKTFDLYDLSLIEGVTTEKVPEKYSKEPMQWYWESQHYKEALGDVIIDNLTTDSGKPFKLNMARVDNISLKQADMLISYKKNNPKTKAIYRKLNRRL